MDYKLDLTEFCKKFLDVELSPSQLEFLRMLKDNPDAKFTMRCSRAQEKAYIHKLWIEYKHKEMQ